MKRFFAIILVALTVVTCALVLVACSGGVRNEKQWNDAMNYVKTCDTVTINYEQEKTTNGRIYKIHDSKTLIYDATNGRLYYESNSKTYNILGSITEQSSEYQYVEVADAQLTNYTKNVTNNRPADWEATTKSYGNQDQANQELRIILESYIKLFGIDDFNYNEFNLRFGKYEKKEVVNDKNTVWKITFSDGKLTNASFTSKHKKGSSDIDNAKITITLLYSAEITTPTDLENAIHK